MIFNSIDFAIFLPVVFLLYWFAFNRNLKLQNLFVVAASYFFYGWWDWRFLILIAITTICSFVSGIMIGNSKIKNQKPKFILFANIAINLGILLYYKYFNFFVHSFNEAFSLFGKELNISTLKIILPVGISFYTFQALSYSIDVYRRRVEPSRDITAFFAFISFFPQLVAGPIERASNLLPQFLRRRQFDYALAADGMRQILWGLFKKIVVADNCGLCSDYIFGKYEFLPGSTLLIGTIFFTIQIYCDFSGYSDIAVGTARLFGFSLMRNFNYPFFSISFAEFWKRNHISLTQWFMDYVYYPMIGSSDRLWRWNLCMVATFFLSGMWHGASWNFVLWGVCHGLLIVFSMNTAKRQKKIEKRLHIRDTRWYQMLRMAVVFLVIAFVEVLFRASYSLAQAFDYMGRILSPSLLSKPFGSTYAGKYVVVLLVVFFLFEWLQRNRKHALELDRMRSKPLRWAIYLLIVVMIYNYGGVQAPFIYFQF